MPVSFTELAIIYSFSIIVCACLAWFISAEIPVGTEDDKHFVHLFSGLIASQGILVSFAMNAGDTLMKLITSAQYHSNMQKVHVVTFFHILHNVLNYFGLCGVLIMSTCAFWLMRPPSRKKRILFPVSLAFFFLEVAIIANTYFLIHTVRLSGI